MKSSSSSPSSSPYIYSQRRSRCIFSMLRRIICLPTRDHTSSSSAAKDDDSSIVTMMKEEKKTVPVGLVARLMGLDSMPDKITRSRSLNSVDQIVQNQPKRTRSKSSTYIELLDTEDDKFIVLSFHNRPHNSNRDKTIAEEAVKKQQACNQENSSSKKQIRLVKKKKKTESSSSSSSDSEESSPISVFDFQQSQETATPTSDDDDSWTRSSNSTRVSISSSPEQDNISIDQQKPPALLNKKTVVVVNGQKKNREMWGRVCDITVADINKGTADWVDKEDLAAEFEVHIMDQLFNELLLH